MMSEALIELQNYAGDPGIKGFGLGAAMAMGLAVPPTFVLNETARTDDIERLRFVWPGEWIVRPSACLPDLGEAAALSGWLDSVVVVSPDGIQKAVRSIEHEKWSAMEVASRRLRRPMDEITVVILLQPYLKTGLSGLLHTCDAFLGVSAVARVSATPGHLSVLNESRSGWDLALGMTAAGELEIMGTETDVQRGASRASNLNVFRELVKMARLVRAHGWHPVELEWLAQGHSVSLLQMQRLPQP